MTKKVTTESWIADCTKKHMGLYDYSKSVYTKSKEKIEIVCKEHGSFWQEALSHRSGGGCPTCAGLRRGGTQRLSTEEFVSKATKQWGDKYEYHLVDYKSSHIKVKIVCKRHGVFSMTPANHAKQVGSQGCPSCGNEVTAQKCRSNTVEFVRKAKLVHGDKYDYSLSEYVLDKQKVSILCQEHGVFRQVPANHLQGQGCPKCKKSGYQTAKSGNLYVLSDGDVTKVGITNRSITTRLKEVKRSGGPLLELKASFYFEDGSIPLALESKVHTYLRSKYQQVSEVFDGSTECFYNVDLEALTSFIVPLAAPTETNNRPNI